MFLLSTTHGAETHSLAAAMAVMDTYVEEGIAARLHALGDRLAAGVREVAAGGGRAATTSSSAAGPATWSSPRSTRSCQPSQQYRTLFLRELISAG